MTRRTDHDDDTIKFWELVGQIYGEDERMHVAVVRHSLAELDRPILTSPRLVVHNVGRGGECMSNVHIRYSVKTTALFSNLAEPRQHAVDDNTLKTLCGRDASNYWKLDVPFREQDVTCSRCRLKMIAI